MSKNSATYQHVEEAPLAWLVCLCLESKSMNWHLARAPMTSPSTFDYLASKLLAERREHFLNSKGSVSLIIDVVNHLDGCKFLASQRTTKKKVTKVELHIEYLLGLRCRLAHPLCYNIVHRDNYL